MPPAIRVLGKIVCTLVLKNVDLSFLQDGFVFTGNAVCVCVCVCVCALTCVCICRQYTLACCFGSFYYPTINLFMGL